MTDKLVGVACVPDIGMISDGDFRRLLERDGPRVLNRTASEIMNHRDEHKEMRGAVAN